MRFGIQWFYVNKQKRIFKGLEATGIRKILKIESGGSP